MKGQSKARDGCGSGLIKEPVFQVGFVATAWISIFLLLTCAGKLQI